MTIEARKKKCLKLIGYIIETAEQLDKLRVGEFCHDEDIYKALGTLHDNESLYFLLQMGPFNKRVDSEENIKLMDQIKKAHGMLVKEGRIKEP